MRISRISQDIKGFQVVSASNGQVIGKVEDVLVDLKKLQVAAIVTSKGNLLKSTIEAIPREEIQVWGEDLILVNDTDVIQKQEDLNGFEEWESALDQIKGKNVLNTNGEQIAELNDIVIDSIANIVGYDLSNVLIEGPVADTKRIHVNATEAFGVDALIIDSAKLYAWEM